MLDKLYGFDEDIFDKFCWYVFCDSFCNTDSDDCSDVCWEIFCESYNDAFCEVSNVDCLGVLNDDRWDACWDACCDDCCDALNEA
jgi:hypothetical protein